MSEHQPKGENEQPERCAEMKIKVGGIEYTFTNHTGWAYFHEKPEHDHLIIVTELAEDNTPQKVDYIFRHIFETYGGDMDATMERMRKAADDWVRDGRSIDDSPGELQAYQLTKEHNGIATFDLQGENAQLSITPLQPPKGKELLKYESDDTVEIPIIEQFELTRRLEGEVGRLGAILAEMDDHDIMEEFMLPQPKSNMPLRWTQSKKVLGDGESGAY